MSLALIGEGPCPQALGVDREAVRSDKLSVNWEELGILGPGGYLRTASVLSNVHAGSTIARRLPWWLRLRWRGTFVWESFEAA